MSVNRDRFRRRQVAGGGGSGAGSLDITSVQRLPNPAYSTTSATLVAIDDTNLPLTVTLGVGDKVYLSFCAPFGISSPGNVIGVDWLVDRPVSADLTIGSNAGAHAAGVIEPGTNGTDSNQRIIEAEFTCTEAGSHVFKPRWKVSGGTTAYITNSGIYTALVNHRAIVKSAA